MHRLFSHEVTFVCENLKRKKNTKRVSYCVRRRNKRIEYISRNYNLRIFKRIIVCHTLLI